MALLYTHGLANDHAGEDQRLIELGPALYLARVPPATDSKRPKDDVDIRRIMACSLDIRDLIVDQYVQQYEGSGTPLPPHTMIDGPPLCIDGEVGMLRST